MQNLNNSQSIIKQNKQNNIQNLCKFHLGYMTYINLKIASAKQKHIFFFMYKLKIQKPFLGINVSFIPEHYQPSYKNNSRNQETKAQTVRNCSNSISSDVKSVFSIM